MDDPRDSSNISYGTSNSRDFADEYEDIPVRKRTRERARSGIAKPIKRPKERIEPKRTRVEARDGTFRCRHCKTMVGPPISGGRHRNHCPLCLYSRHVDRSMPGDRAEDCHSMMPAVGLFTRRNGEQMLLHRCAGCGVERRNRIAADDNTVALMRLPIIESSRISNREELEEAERSA